MLRYAARYYRGEDGWEMVEVPAFDALTQGEDERDVRLMARDLVGSLVAVAVWDKGEEPPEPDATLPESEGWEWVYPDIKTSIAYAIRTLRTNAGCSMDQAAELVGVSKGTYQRWEHPEKCNAQVETLERLATAFGRTVLFDFAEAS